MKANNNRRSTRGEQTREALLNAAERCFAMQSYHGASLRDIASAAGTRLGLVHYHFGNKEDLFRAVVMRRLPDLVLAIEQSFAAAEQAAHLEPLDLEQTIDAFLRPFLRIRTEAEHPLNLYVAMVSHLMSSYRVPEIKDTLARLGEVTALFEPRLRALLPALPDQDFYAGLYVMEAALIFMVQDPGFADDLTRGQHQAARIDSMTGQVVQLFAAGLRGMSPSADPASR